MVETGGQSKVGPEGEERLVLVTPSGEEVGTAQRPRSLGGGPSSEPIQEAPKRRPTGPSGPSPEILAARLRSQEAARIRAASIEAGVSAQVQLRRERSAAVIEERERRADIKDLEQRAVGGQTLRGGEQEFFLPATSQEKIRGTVEPAPEIQEGFIAGSTRKFRESVETRGLRGQKVSIPERVGFGLAGFGIGAESIASGTTEFIKRGVTGGQIRKGDTLPNIRGTGTGIIDVGIGVFTQLESRTPELIIGKIGAEVGTQALFLRGLRTKPTPKIKSEPIKIIRPTGLSKKTPLIKTFGEKPIRFVQPKLKRDPLTFTIDESALRNQRNRLRSGADVVKFEKGLGRIVDAPKPKIKTDPLTFTTPDLDFKMLQQAKRLKSGAEIIKFEKGVGKIVDAPRTKLKRDPLTFTIDESALRNQRNRLRSGADVIQAQTKKGQLQLIIKPLETKLVKLVKQKDIIIVPQKVIQRERALSKLDLKDLIIAREKRAGRLQKKQKLQTISAQKELQGIKIIETQKAQKLETQLQSQRQKTRPQQLKLQLSPIQQSRQQQPSLSRTSEKQILRQRVIQLQAQSVSVRQKQPQLQLQLESPIVTQKQPQSQLQLESPTFKQPQLQLEFPRTRSRETPRPIEPPPRLRPRETPRPEEPPPRTIQIRQRPIKIRPIRRQQFQVSIRRGGIFRPLARTERLSTAIQIGAEKTGRTLAASFKITGDLSTRRAGTPRGFRRGKKDRGLVFIEQRGQRLSTSSEVKQIQRARRRGR
jgi:hypothetical protein